MNNRLPCPCPQCFDCSCGRVDCVNSDDGRAFCQCRQGKPLQSLKLCQRVLSRLEADGLADDVDWLLDEMDHYWHQLSPEEQRETVTFSVRLNQRRMSSAN